MTNPEILELAEKLEFCYRDEDDWRKWNIILKFALAIRKETIEEVLTSLKDVPNPEANRTAINRIMSMNND